MTKEEMVQFALKSDDTVENTMWQIYQQGRADVIDEELQNFAQWLWDSHYLVDEAFTIRLVEQYKEELKEKKV